MILTEQLFDLLLEFFVMYTTPEIFDVETMCVCVRTGRLVSKKEAKIIDNPYQHVPTNFHRLK
jgi:hypothetical protein